MTKNKTTKEIWIASSHLTETKEQIEKILEFEPNGIVIKSALYLGPSPCKRKCWPCQKSYQEKRFFIDQGNPFTYYTFHERQTCEYLFSEEVGEILSWMKKEYPHIRRVASIIGKTKREILEMAKLFERKEAQIIEFNSQKYLQKTEPSQTASPLDILVEILKAIKENVSLPIFIKLGPELLSTKVFQELTEKADGITLTNSFVVKATPKKLKKAIKERGKDELIVHGDPLWFYVEKYLPIARKYFNYVSACGGIYSQARAKRAFALGASSVQLCSAIVFRGPQVIKEMKRVAA